MLHEVLRQQGAAAAAKHAFERFGRYDGNEVAWRSVCEQLLEQGDFAGMDVGDLLALVEVLADDVELTRASFWERMTAEVAPTLRSAKLAEISELAAAYTRVGCWEEPVFIAALDRVREEQAVHWMEPQALTQLLDTFSRAGPTSQRLSRLTGQLFNEAQERFIMETSEFDVDSCIAVVKSMARFRYRGGVPVLHKFGSHVLHPELTELPSPQISAVCYAYSELGWRHDTVFRNVSLDILSENEQLQRARALGVVGGVERKYSASDIALIVFSLLNLKMHRGRTSWCRWADNYDELIDLLVRRLEEELPEVRARPLAAAAYALGRAREGTEELCQAMYEQMVNILRDGEPGVSANIDRGDPPQYELARFLYGLTLMGSTKKKKLDTQWLMQWVTQHLHTLLLRDVIVVNRQLVALGCFDTDYLKVFVPWLSEQVGKLSKTDIMEVTTTYNQAGLRDEDLGRHFFWALGKQFQKLHGQGLPRRPQYKRVG